MATHNEPRHAAADMASGKRRSKVPAHWWDLVESQLATARYDQETPGIGEHTWRLVPKVAVVAKPKALPQPPPPPPPVKVAAAPTPPAPKPTPVAPPPKATVAKGPTPKPKATPAKAATVAPNRPHPDVAGAVAAVIATDRKPGGRLPDPRLPAIGAVQTFTHPKSGTVYTWKVINDRGNVVLGGGGIEPAEQFSSVSSAAARINHGTSTNGYLFFGLGKKV